VFYAPATLTAGNISIAASSACILMVRHAGNEAKLYAADPSRSAASVELTLSLPGICSAKTLSVALPAGTPGKGKTCELAIAKDGSS
jgi:hypothetical protein